MRTTGWLVDLVLRLYPRTFRDRFGDEVRSFANERAREPRYSGARGRVRLWFHLLGDGVTGSVREHANAVRGKHARDATPPLSSSLLPDADRPEETMATLLHDARYALRTLRRRPAFTVVSTVTLALGIGATAAIFGVVDALLFRPLRYPNPEQIVVVTMTRGASLEEPPAYPDFVDWRQHARSFQALGVMRNQSINLTGGETPERLSGAFVTASFFSLLGADVVAGRLFAPDETEVGTARPVAVISEGLWRRRFGADIGIIGRTLVLNGQPAQVVGVVASTFNFFAGTEVWIPITYYPNVNGLTRKDHSMTVVGRLQPGVTVTAATAEMDGIAKRLAEQFPVENGGTGIYIQTLHSLLVGDVRAPLYTVLAAVGLLLVIACANVANLQLSHAVARRREMSVRAALGAGRSRLARQLLTESVILSALGGLLGIAVAYGAVSVLIKILPVDLTFFSPIGVDGRVMAFAALVSITTGLVFGLAPALHASRASFRDALAARSGSLAARVGRIELRAAFVVAQIALSVILLIGAGLLARSLMKLQRVDLGFDPSNLLTMEFRLPATKYTEPQQIADFFTRAIAEIRSVPGVTNAALARAVPLSGNGDSRAYAVSGAPGLEEGKAPIMQLNTVSPQYFKTMRLPLVAGRDIDERDDANAPRVVVVNETLARREWPNGSAIGQQLRYADSDRWMTVVGVARDAKHFGPADQPRPQAYIPYMQAPQIFTSVVVRTAGDPMRFSAPVRDAIWRVDRDQPVWRLRSMESIVTGALGSKRVLLGLVAVFAAVAVMLSGVGIYGVMSFAVTQRTHEVGVRMALGAQGSEVRGLIVRQGVKLTIVALAIGVAGAFGAARMLASQLFGVTPADPLTFATVPILLAVVSIVACYVPARRASKLDPLVALRRE